MTTLDPRDIETVENIVAHSGSSFAMGMKFLPEDRRHYLFAIYAFCRELDDIADGEKSPDAKNAALNEWADKIEIMYCGSPSCAITRVLHHGLETYDLREEEFLNLVEGMRMDSNGPIVAPDKDTYALYCRRVAGAVGVLSLPIFGRSVDEAEEFAVLLGEALQTTNILRDVAEDAGMGRLYIPRDLLEQHGIEATDVHGVLSHPELRKVLAELARTAREKYREADRVLGRIGKSGFGPALLMRAVYEKLLTKMEKRGWEILEPRMRLSSREKAMIALRGMAFGT